MTRDRARDAVSFAPNFSYRPPPRSASGVIAMSPTATSLRALRNRAIILLGFAGAFRRSELVALNVEGLEETAEGMLVTLRRDGTRKASVGGLLFLEIRGTQHGRMDRAANI
jgi:hypothetical protein